MTDWTDSEKISTPFGQPSAESKRAPGNETCVSTTADKSAKLVGRVRRIRDQIGAVERALERRAASSDLLELIAGMRGALNGLMAEVIGEHIWRQMVAGCDTERAHAVEELIDIIRSYLK